MQNQEANEGKEKEKKKMGVRRDSGVGAQVTLNTQLESASRSKIYIIGCLLGRISGPNRPINMKSVSRGIMSYQYGECISGPNVLSI